MLVFHNYGKLSGSCNCAFYFIGSDKCSNNNSLLIMKKIVSSFILIFLALTIFNGCNRVEKEQPFILQNGDLLFQDIDCGDMCTAIETVTFGWHGAKFSHVGIAVVDSVGKIQVLEAISKGVSLTSVDEFMKRSLDSTGNPKIIVGRVLSNDKNANNAAVKRALTYLGKPYDTVFDIANNAYYCSELVYFAYRDSWDAPLFELKPMTFNDPATGTVFPVWKIYYDLMKVAIPEGAPGLNPGGISQSGKIEIVHIYGQPQGMAVDSLK